MADFTHKEEYIETVGRRKTASARVRISKSKEDEVVVNEKDFEEHFPTKELQGIAKDALKHSADEDSFKVTAKIKGGGIHAQAEALRHGIARALIEYNAEVSGTVQNSGLTVTREEKQRKLEKD